MKNILFTTAYSNSSKNTWRYALQLAKYFEAKITVFHVFENAAVSLSSGNNFFDNNSEDPIISFNEARFKEQQTRMHNFVQENTSRQYKDIPMDYIVATGSVAAAILQEETEAHYDLVILGTTTNLRLSHKLFGNVSLKVVAQSRTPVFLVPPMAEYEGLSKIVYATNFESGDAQAIQFLLDWVRAFQAKLHLLHISRNTYGANQAAEKMKNLYRSFRESGDGGFITTQLMQDDIAKGVEAYLATIRADMVALTTHKRGFFAQLFDPGVTNQIATTSLVPVLIMKR